MYEAIAAALALVGTILGLGVSANQQKKNREQNEALQQQQNEFNATQAELANQRQRQNYTDLESPQAKMEQIKQAGQSPSYYYAGNGLSGALRTAPQATATPIAPYYTPDTMGLMLAGMGGNVADVFKKTTEAGESKAKTNLLEQQETNAKKEATLLDGDIALQGWNQRQVLTISDSTLQSFEIGKGKSTAWSIANAMGYSISDSENWGHDENAGEGWNANLGGHIGIHVLKSGIDAGTQVGGGHNWQKGHGDKYGYSTSTAENKSHSQSGANSENANIGATQSKSNSTQCLVWFSRTGENKWDMYIMRLKGTANDYNITIDTEF